MPEITDAVSWVATDSVPAAETAPLAGSKRRTPADDLPPTRPPRISRVAPSGTAWALDIGVGSPLPTGAILSGGGEPRVVGTAAAGAGAVGDGPGVVPAEGRDGEKTPWPPRPNSRGMAKMASTARTTAPAIVRVSRRRRRRRASALHEYGGIKRPPPRARLESTQWRVRERGAPLPS